LDAGIQAGVRLNYSCKTGRCGTCKVNVLQGESVAVLDEIGLTAEELTQGFIYSCCRQPLGDMQLDAEDLSEYGLTDAQVIPAKIDQLHRFNEDLLEVKLRTPPGRKIHFLPGQYIQVIYGSLKRSYSLANATSEELSLLIRKYPGGQLSEYWFEKAAVNDLLRIEGPLGTFFIRDSNSETLLLLATGTGIAPLKSILESGAHKRNKYKKVILFWGLRKASELCWKIPEYLETEIDYIPVMSRDEEWTGEKGYVQDKALALDLDLKNCDVYACGNIQMIHAAKEKLVAKGLPENQFYADAFLPS
jgi:CDP-4-dehydro-6-deoxyglucose reductase